MSDEFNHKAVFLITIDALNLKHLNIYGYDRNTAPNLEKYVKQGSIFFNAVSNGPETPSAFSAIFTSVLPFLEGGYSPLPSQKITFPQILKENKIFTLGIHSNPNLGEFYNYHRGFNTFLDGERYKSDIISDKHVNMKQRISFFLKKIFDYKDILKKLLYRIPGVNKTKDFLRKKVPLITELLLPITPMAYNAPYIVNKIELLLKEVQKPLFFWAHFMDLHSPYNPPSDNIRKYRNTDFTLSEKEFLNRHLYQNPKKYMITPEVFKDYNILYDAQINFLDEYLGKLFRVIEAHFKNDCLIIITADHGESLLDFGLTGHQGSIHDDLLKIPLFIIEIGKKKNKSTINDIAQSIDIPCTILDYYGIEIPETYRGKSLIPLLRDSPIKNESFIISECFQKGGLLKRNTKEGYKLISIKANKFKYIFDEERDKEFLFDIQSDPSEKKNLVEKFPSKLDEFRRIKDDHLQEVFQSSDEKLKIIRAISTLKKSIGSK